MIKISKGLLSFLSGLGFMGLGFYIVFFTLIEMDRYKILSNYIFFFSLLTSILACIVVYFLSIAFSFGDIHLNIDATKGGFIGGILSMIAIIIMILSFRLESMNLMEGLKTIDKIHPIITFFLASACTILLIWPEEMKEERW